MKQIVNSIFMAILFLALAGPLAYCEAIDINELITHYIDATEIQRQQIEAESRYKTIAVSGIIADVIDWNTFDERTDLAGHYYKVITEPQMARAGISYEVWALYKDKSEVEAFNKGQEIKADGTFVKIVNEIDLLSIMVYMGELTPEDKVMLEQ